MIISYSTLLPIDNPHTVAVDISVAFKPLSVRDNVTELNVWAIITNVSNAFNSVVFVSYLIYFFLDLLFLSFK